MNIVVYRVDHIQYTVPLFKFISQLNLMNCFNFKASYASNCIGPILIFLLFDVVLLVYRPSSPKFQQRKKISANIQTGDLGIRRPNLSKKRFTHTHKFYRPVET